MRGEHERGAAGQCVQNHVQAREHDDVGVEIQHGVIAFRQQLSQHERLYRRVEFHHVVAEREFFEVGDAKLRCSDDTGLLGIEVLVRKTPVGKAQKQVHFFVLATYGGKENLRHRDVVVRADGEYSNSWRLVGNGHAPNLLADDFIYGLGRIAAPVAPGLPGTDGAGKRAPTG